MALRGHFRRQLGSSPAAYRAAYRARRPQGERPQDTESAPGGPGPGMPGHPGHMGHHPGQPGQAPAPLHPEHPVPLQSRRTAAASAVGQSSALSASLPGQRSAP